MGKSPGKWIKTVLFGKKSSKASILKEREKFANEREVLVSTKAPEAVLAAEPPISLQPAPYSIDRDEANPVLQNREVSDPSLNDGILLTGNQDTDVEGSVTQDALDDPEKIRLEQAATRAQATFRGYLARRAFRTLKGIIRLQALIRGHLVRRQAVATLYCMVGILRVQALGRGRQVRDSDIGRQVHERCNLIILPAGSKLGNPGLNRSVRTAKLSANAFICKLLVSSPTAMPLHLHYEAGEPNSVMIWLERWSTSYFWKPVPQTKKPRETRSQKRQSNGHMGETDMGRPKRSVRRVPPANLDSISLQAAPEYEKPKRNVRKATSHPTEPVVENPEKELEKVKRSLRKVHNPIVETSVQSEAEIEKPKQSFEKAITTSDHDILEQSRPRSIGLSLNDSGRDVVEQNAVNLNEKMKKETTLAADSLAEVETIPEPLLRNESFSFPMSDQVIAESKLSTESPRKDESTPLTNGNHQGLSLNEDSARNENQKICKKASTPVRQERPENGTENSPTLPGYMQATESAKAKLRLQGSPRFGQEGAEKNSIRRHSLPSVSNKASSHSPRTQKPVQGKGGNRSDRSQPLRDGSARAEWKR